MRSETDGWVSRMKAPVAEASKAAEWVWWEAGGGGGDGGEEVP